MPFPTIFALLLGYLLGSIPFGLLLVKLVNGTDIREVASGRTGGTNAMRAAGFPVGLATGILDGLKGFAAGALAGMIVPGSDWVKVLAAVLAIVGHNHSIFLLHRENRTWKFGGGAGGATCLGGAASLWMPILAILLPVLALTYLLIGYASVTTLSIALSVIVVFAVRAMMGLSPWAYVVYGVLAEILVALALIPNINRLIAGNERPVGLRSYLHKKSMAAGKGDPDKSSDIDLSAQN